MHKSTRLPFTIAANHAAFAARNGNVARRTLAPASYATRTRSALHLLRSFKWWLLGV